MSFTMIIVLILVAIVGYMILIYNNFISLRAGIASSWSDIDVQLKRRYDLIPALVDTIKGYKSYEAETLERVVKARQIGVDANSIEDKSKASEVLSGALGRLFALSEAYPDLKANTTFIQLQEELSSIEEAIQSSRRYYNAIVRDYNSKVESFPHLFVARKFGFEEKFYFEVDKDEETEIKKMPKIDLGA